MKHTDEFKKGWLVGIFDGEGTIFFRGGGGGRLHAMHHLSIANTDMILIDKCMDYLKYFGIHCILDSRKKMSKPHWKQVHNVRIYRQDDIVRFYELIGFFSPHKVKKLEDAVAWIKRPRSKYNAKELRSLYWDSGLSYAQIAQHYGLKGSNSVKTLFDRFQIPRRDKSCGFEKYNKRPRKYNREEVVELRSNGMTLYDICRHYGVSINCSSKFSRIIKGQE